MWGWPQKILGSDLPVDLVPVFVSVLVDHVTVVTIQLLFVVQEVHNVEVKEPSNPLHGYSLKVIHVKFSNTLDLSPLIGV
jgi:hypothetical protein